MMRFSLILGLAGVVVAKPIADPLPLPTAAAEPHPVPIAAPEPTAMPEPQFGVGITTPFGSISMGLPNQPSPLPGQQQGGGWPGGPGHSSACSANVLYCAYTALSEGVLDVFGYSSTAAPPSKTTIYYVPTPYQNQPYPGQPYQNQPYNGNNGGRGNNNGGRNGGWP